MTKNITIYKKASYSPKNPEIGTPIDIQEYFAGVLNGRWQDSIFRWRNLPTKEDRNEKKRFILPCVTASGEFEGRTAKDLVKHSGLLCIDIDAKDNEMSMGEIKELLMAIPEVYAIHLSVSGNGLAVYFKIRTDRHIQSFEAIERMLANDYGVIADPSCKDVCRLRFVSYDPDLHLNLSADTWKTFLPKPKKSDITVNKLANHIHTGADIDYVIDQISRRNVDIAPDYFSWLRIGFALADELGESGRNHFALISSMYSGKQKTDVDKQYTRCVRRGKSGVTIATFFYYAKQAGLEITSPRTQKIVTIGKQRRKQENSGSGSIKDGRSDAKKYLKDNEDIHGHDVDEVLDQVYALPEEELKKTTSGNTVLDELEAFLKSNWDFQINEITGAVEVDGKLITDNKLNDIYLDCMRIVDEKIKKSLVIDLIHSSFSPVYNPIFDFIEENKTLEPVGCLDELAQCIISPISNEDPSFIRDFIEKWFLGIIGSIHGTHSVTALYLTGHKMGIGKSKFFQGLLPKELSGFFSSEEWTEKQQDMSMIATQNLLIFDDEGISLRKMGIDFFKRISDKEIFKCRLPYGHYILDLKRLGVFCGTSNSDSIIDDRDNRRIIPITVTDIDLDRFYRINKTELFIEVYNLYKTGKKYFLTSEDKERLNRFTSEAYEVCDEVEFVSKFFEPCERGDIGSKHMMGVEIADYIMAHSQSRTIKSKVVSRVMKEMGFVKDNIAYGNRTKRVWGFWVREISGTDPIDEVKDDSKDDLPF